jgi:hypothetical protein
MASTCGSVPSTGANLRRSIIEYFLEIFRLQIKASRSAPVEYREIDRDADGHRRYYELRIRPYDNWKSRRMSIMPLGEGSGSKSQCFYVIYDDHLVVKIPPQPITDFSKYIDAINKEQKIAARLTPRICITPTVSVILKKVFPIEDGGGERPEDTPESAYIKWLSDHPEFQSCLKIDGRFVFFMDLARYYMLSSVIAGIHDSQAEAVAEEIAGNPGLLWEQRGFEGRYGAQHSLVPDTIKTVCQAYERQLPGIFEARRLQTPRIQYKFKGWFLNRLAGQSLVDHESDVPREIVVAVEALIDTVLAENQPAVAAYRDIIRQFVRRKSLSASKVKISSVVANIIDLLAYLRRKGVAMRDFKPDNVLVAGDPLKYPGFLSSPDAFFLGLIDVETAVGIDNAAGRSEGQPQLGGTPFFSTPSQIVPNRILAESLGDVARTLYMQDWYAGLVMIYRVVTGERLFRKTATTIPTVIREIEEALCNKALSPDVFARVSRRFWRVAAVEFRQKVAAKEKMLSSLVLDIPKTAFELLREVFNELENQQSVRLRSMIADQAHFKSEGNQRQLLLASAGQIGNLLSKERTAANPSSDRLQFLEGLTKEKERLDGYRRSLQSLGSPPARLTTYVILDALFEIVLGHMLPEKWGRPGGMD